MPRACSGHKAARSRRQEESINGTAATFKVVSSSLVTATVPAGATSGKIQVTTPTRTLSSRVSFRVLP